MTRPLYRRAPLLATALFFGSACADAEAPRADAPAATAVDAAPTAGDREYARLTAGWTPAALDACGRQLREALGTRDLVVGAADGVRDPDGRAKAEMEDARGWIARGDEGLAGVRAKLEAGQCDGDLNVVLDEATQAYVKAGTSAVQAGQIAGG